MVAERSDDFKRIDPVGSGKWCIDVKISEGMARLSIGIVWESLQWWRRHDCC